MRLGLCCLVLGKESSEFKSTTVTWAKKNNEKIYDKLNSIYAHNLNELCKALNYCINNKIYHYRISSSLFPLADLEPYDDFFFDFTHNKNNFNIARDTIAKYFSLGGRVSTHPSQFCIITNPSKKVSASALKNLEMHGTMFDCLSIPQDYRYPINIHLSNGKKPLDAYISAKENLEKLSQSVRSRLVFENEDKSYWTWQKIKTNFPGIPVTLDYHHRNINNEDEVEYVAHEECIATWHQHNTKPLFHYSEGKEHVLDRSHADYVMRLPRYRDIDLEIEAKMKNLAILKIYDNALDYSFSLNNINE